MPPPLRQRPRLRRHSPTLYLALCVIGTALPLWQFVPWLRAHGLDLRLFCAELMSTRIGAFFGMDVIVSAAVLMLFIASENRRALVRGSWLAVAATLTVGVSLGLPLFLYLRERASPSTQSIS